MHSYIKKILLFCIPIILLFSPPLIFQFVLFYVSGENNLGFANSKLKENTIIGYKYDNLRDINFKHRVLTKNQFDIIGIGSSRVLQFREKFFNGSFYAWNIINYSPDYLYIFQILKSNNKLPSFFLLQLDERTFNKDFDQAVPTLQYLSKPPFLTVNPDLNRSFIKDYLSLNRRAEFNNYSLKGLNAQYYFSGYRHDGSYQYGKYIYNMNFDKMNFDSTFVSQRDQIDENNKFFNINYSNNSLNNLEKFLDECSRHNVKVICFFQPYPNSIVKTLMQKGFYDRIINTRLKVENLFKTKPHLYLNIDSLPADDNLSMDGVHPTEKSNINLLLTIPENTIYRTILNEKRLVQDVASNICVDSDELQTVKLFFQSTHNYNPSMK